ncbi:MAG: hypothetical protein AAF927_10650 [Bacteroidota bacterium]
MKTFIFLLMLGFFFVWLIDYRVQKPQGEPQTENQGKLLQKIEVEKARKANLLSQMPSPDFPDELTIDANIKCVYYGQTNHVSFDLSFDDYDLCDTAVIIELMNGKWLSWQWIEEGNYGPEFRVHYTDKNPIWQDSLVSFRELSASQNWQSMITQRLLRVETQKSVHPAGGTYLSALILHFSYAEIAIRGIEEPSLEYVSSPKDFVSAPDWTAIVFNSEVNNQKAYS